MEPTKQQRKTKYARRFTATLALCMSISFAAPVLAQEKSSIPATPAAQESSWKKASKEIGEAASAVGEASKEAWGKTKETSAEVWDKTKDTSAKVWDKTKETGSDVADGGEGVADSTVEGSKSAWQKTKDTSARWYTAAKDKVHEVTAPSTEK